MALNAYLRLVGQKSGEIRGSVIYQAIEWTWTDGAIVATDDWEDPVV